MKKLINSFLVVIILIFFFTTYKYYSSNKNVEAKGYNRNNINEIINDKTKNLKLLENDTDNIIIFNDGFSNKIKDNKPRSFWNLLKSE